MFISTQSVIPLFLHASVIVYLVFQMMFAITLFHLVLVREYFMELRQLYSYPVLLLPLCFILQDSRCTWVMLPYPSHSRIHLKY
jgi:hypothetical protein